MPIAWALGFAAAMAAPGAFGADETFDLSEIEPRTVETSGFAELRGERLALRDGAALFPLSFAGEPPRRTLERTGVAAEFALLTTAQPLRAYARLSLTSSHDAYTSVDTGKVLEGGLRLRAGDGGQLDLGKQVQRWGKGYAWNPLAFFERPKDPNDPLASREGLVMASLDLVRSLPGTLSTVGLTAVAMPVTPDVNHAFGEVHHVDFGAKLYLLWADTDIDLAWAAAGSRPQRFGFDLSRNLGTALEVHAEWARSLGATRATLQADGTVATQRETADTALVGLRYLTEREVTWIAEMLRQGGGYDTQALGGFYDLLDQAFSPAGTPAQRAAASALARAGAARPQAGRRYAYLRASAKDPFDWLYVTPSLTLIRHLDDDSLQATAEALYTGWQDIELRVRAQWLRGRAGSEMGEKPVRRRVELTARLYF
jgi:hypothetical protein